MRGSGTAALTPDAVGGAVREHVDRVHDLVRRQGCPPGAAAGVVEAGALELVAEAAQRPAPLPELVGRWFARAAAAAGDGGRGTGAQHSVEAALDRLDAGDRLALLLHDAYDLGGQASAAGLQVGREQALRTVGQARLALLRGVGATVPPPPGHRGDEAALARLGHAGPRASRHLAGCPACRQVVGAQEAARQLLAELPVAAMDEDDREDLLERVCVRARAVLPTRPDAPARERALLPLAPTAAALAVAVLAGVGLGVLLGRSQPAAPAGPIEAVASAPLVTAPAASAPPVRPALPRAAEQPETPSSRVFTYPATPPQGPPLAPPAAPSLQVAPGSGPAGAEVTVSGTGWSPGARVPLELLDPRGRRAAGPVRVPVDAAGRFAVRLEAGSPDTPPGDYRVQAGEGAALAPYRILDA